MHYSGLVFQWRKNMETKKLVLGFCALAAVTGGAPQVFGVPVALKRLLALAIPDDGIRTKYEADYDAVLQQLKEEVGAFVGHCNEEVKLIRNAYLKEHQAHFLRAINDSNTPGVRAIDERVAGMRRDLAKAEKAVKAAKESKFFIWWNQTKVNRLTSKIGKAEQQRTCILQKSAARESLAARLINEARQSRLAAYAFHDKRVALVNTLCDTSAREDSMLADSEAWGSVGGLSIPCAAKMEMSVHEYLAVIRAAKSMRYAVTWVNDSVNRAVKRMPGYAWFCENGGNSRLYDKLSAPYCCKGSIFYLGDAALVAPIDRLCDVTAGAIAIEAIVRKRLMDLISAAYSAAREAAGDSGHGAIADDSDDDSANVDVEPPSEVL
jgi:hypothetical protein